MFERLLAALIILALLVLVMFVAFPDPTRNGDTSPALVDRPPATQPGTQVARPEPEPAPSSGVAPPKEETAKTERDRLTPGAGDPSVPDPARDLAERDVPATPTQRGARQSEQSLAPPKQENVAKRFLDRLPREPDVAPPPRAVATPKRSRPPEDNIVSRTTISKREVRVAAKRDAERADDGITRLVRRTTEVPAAWRRNHDYEYTGGRCECDCERPYWARTSDSPCWD